MSHTIPPDVQSDDDRPNKAKAAKDKPADPLMPLEEAKKAVLGGYVLDDPGNADRLLKTLVLRQLEAGPRGFKSAQLPQARLIAKALVEEAGMRASGKGYGDAKLCALFKKHVLFEPITSLRRTAT
jgi:hypothetical protein